MNRKQSILSSIALLLLPTLAMAHGVAARDASFIETVRGVQVLPFMYLGAKHMVTGYDHLLFLAGVIFFLYRLRDVAIYASLFALGHSLTLMGSVLLGWQANAYVVDAIIGLSVAWKAFENLGGMRTLGISLDSRLAVLGFGLVHGLGLATKLQALNLSPDGLLGNMLSFNVGVELGQLTALTFMVLLFVLWRSTSSFTRHARLANFVLMTAGFLLCGFQLAGLWLA